MAELREKVWDIVTNYLIKVLAEIESAASTTASKDKHAIKAVDLILSAVMAWFDEKNSLVKHDSPNYPDHCGLLLTLEAWQSLKKELKIDTKGVAYETPTQEKGPGGAGSEPYQEGGQNPVLDSRVREEGSQENTDGQGAGEVGGTSLPGALDGGPPKSAPVKITYQLAFAHRPEEINEPLRLPTEVIFVGYEWSKLPVLEQETSFHVLVRVPGQAGWAGRESQKYYCPYLLLLRKLDCIGTIYLGDIVNTERICEIDYQRETRRNTYSAMNKLLYLAELEAHCLVFLEKLFERMEIEHDDDLGNWFLQGDEEVADAIGIESMDSVKRNSPPLVFFQYNDRGDYRDGVYVYLRTVDTLGGTIYHKLPRRLARG